MSVDRELNMANALIGATGFVGGNLLQHGFSDHYNSRNIADVAGRAFDTVVCAAAPGSMFEANKFPDRDKAHLDAMTEHLPSLKADRFVLVSSIAVLADFAGQDDEDSTAFQTDLAYGRHRRALEVACTQIFDNCLILRLPALFGAGLKKNFMFDMLNPVPSMLTPQRIRDAQAAVSVAGATTLQAIYTWDESVNMHRVDRAALDASGQRAALEDALTQAGLSAVTFTNPASTYQYYNLAALWDDMQTALAAGLDVLHMAMEPIQAGVIHRAVTGLAMPDAGSRLHHEDMRTRHVAAIRGGAGPYLASADQVLADLVGFAAAARGPAA
jgi:hypothetical protein